MDWNNEKVFLAQLKEKFRPKVETWNNTFDMPYHIFRREIKHIAQLNLSRVENAGLADLDEVPQGEIIIPIDDDDWLSPQVANVLTEKIEPEKEGYYWHKDYINRPPTIPIKIFRFLLPKVAAKRGGQWPCSTNNYAFTNNYNLASSVFTHDGAKYYFDAYGSKMKKIDQHLSIMNRTIASQTSMNPGKQNTSKRLLLKYYYLYTKMYERIQLPNHEWCNPYLSMMSDVMHELKPK